MCRLFLFVTLSNVLFYMESRIKKHKNGQLVSVGHFYIDLMLIIIQQQHRKSPRHLFHGEV